MTTTEVVLAPLTADEAERLSMRIELRLGVIADNKEAVMPMIREAIERDAASALGFNGVSDYISTRFGAAMSRIGFDLRQAVAPELKAAEMSNRAIAEVLGVSEGTVRNDLARAGAQSYAPAVPVRVTGLDGKSYAPTAPIRVDRETGEVSDAPAERTAPQRAFTAQFEDAVLELDRAVARLVRLGDDARLPQYADQVSTRYRSDIIRSHDSLTLLLNRI